LPKCQDSPRAQRLERDQTCGSEALMAVASAFGVEVRNLARAYWIAERKPLRALTIHEASDFEEAINRAHDEFTYQIYAGLRPEVREPVDELLKYIFSDIWAMGPGDDILDSWIESVSDSVRELRSMGFVLFSIQEQRDIFVKGPGPGERKPLEDWTRAYFLLVPRHGAFHLGGQDSKEPLHRFNDRCQLAIDSIYRSLHEEIVVGTFASALHALGDHGEKIVWCDTCFPAGAEGERIGWDYLEEITARSRTDLVARWSDINSDDVLEGLS